MASITKRQRKKGVVYTALVRVKGHPAVSATFNKRSEAQAWGEDVEAALRGGGYIGADPPGDKDFIGALDRYLAEVTVHKKANTRDREHVAQQHLRSFFSGCTLVAITADRVAAYRDMRAKTVGASCIHQELAILSHLYTVARQDWALKISNPVAQIRRPTLNRGRTRFLSELEARVLLDVCCESRNPKLYGYVLLLMHSGMRPSEGAGLQWSQVDFDKRIISLTDTKNTAPRRVPFSKLAAASLTKIKPEPVIEHAPVFLPDQVSNNIAKRPNRYFSRAFNNAVRYAEIDDFHMHDLRHTAASYMIMRGVDLRTLADILGHKSMDMVMRYSHLIDTHKLDAIDKIAGLGL